MKPFKWLVRMMMFVVGLLFGFAQAGAFMADPAPAGDPAPSPSPEPAPTPAPAGPSYTQADLDRARDEERKKIEAKQAADKKKTEEAALTEQQKYKELAEQRGTELEQLRAKAEQADTYAKRLNDLIEAELKDWPEEAKALDPGGDDLSKRFDWLEKARPLVGKLKTLPKAPDTDLGNQKKPSDKPGAKPSDKPTGEQPKSRYRFQSSSDVSW